MRWAKIPARLLRAGVARLLAPRGRRRSPSEAEIRSVLVLRIDERVGNVLLTTPLFEALSQRFPQARICALVAASKVALIGGRTEVIPFEKREFFSRPLRFWRMVRGLRADRFDVVIDASHWHRFSLTSALLLGWTNAPVRIAHARGDAHRFATHTVAPPGEVEYEPKTKLRLLAPLGGAGPVTPISTPLGVERAAADRVEVWLREEGLEAAGLVGLQPGARKPDHRVDPEVFAALARAVSTLGLTPVVLWGPGEEALAATLGSKADVRLAPPTSLAELAALHRRCRAVVSNDTGPMHLAVACGTPTLALFLRADPGRWAHADPPNAVVACDGKTCEEIVAVAEPLLVRMLDAPRRAGVASPLLDSTPVN